MNNDIEQLIADLNDDQLALLVRELRDEPSAKSKKKHTDPVIYSKKPSIVHLTVHCLHCNQHYTTLKQIRDNDLIYYSTNRDGSVAQTKLKAQGETWIDTHTQCCSNCERYIRRMSLEQLTEKYLELLLKGRRF